jgi:hypothetical protein
VRAPRLPRPVLPATVAGASPAGASPAGAALAGAALIGAALVAVALLTGAGASAAAAAGAPRAAAPRPVADAAQAGRVVLLGVDGLEWSDVTAQTMPTLATLSGQGALASLVTRTAGDTTCAADGWLTLGAGVRSTGGRVPSTPPGADPLSTVPRPGCPGLPATPSTRGSFTVSGYSSYRAANVGTGTAADLGALAAPVRQNGGCVAASGAGALLAAADGHGRVADYLGPADALTAVDLDACALTLVDLGGYLAGAPSAGTRYPPPVSRAAVFSAVDARIAALMPKLPTDSALVVAGLDDADPATPRLHTLLVTGRGADGSAFTPGRRLRAASTRTDGLVQTVDLTPSLLHWIGLSDNRIAAADPHPPVGPAITLGSPAPEGDGAAVLSAVRTDRANIVYQDTDRAFIRWMLCAVLLLALAAGAVFATVGIRPRAGRVRRLTLLTLAATATVLGAVIPVSFLVGLDDWSAAANPAQRLYGLTAVVTVLLGLVVHAVCRFGRLRDRPLAPAGILAVLTLALITGDVSSGARLQRQTPFGFSVIDGERFSGIGDQAIGVYCAAAVIGAFFAAGLVLADRGFALLTVVLLGVLATVVCGLPFWGERPRGAIGLVCGFAVLTLPTARQRSTWRGLLIVLAVTCGVGWAADGAGFLLPETALLLAVPLCVAARALGLLRRRPDAETAAAAAASDGAGSVRRPVPLGVQDERRGADEP